MSAPQITTSEAKSSQFKDLAVDEWFFSTTQTIWVKVGVATAMAIGTFGDPVEYRMDKSVRRIVAVHITTE